ncbi:MAG: hypothetical protein ACI9MC_001673, partial [Kiritimatiellia bacterium]
MRSALPLVIALATGCVTGPTDATDIIDTPAECLPLESAFDTNVRPIIQSRCSRCHGEEPDFGAPFSLLDYPSLIEGEPGRRVVDRMVDRLIDGSMPPATEPVPSHAELDTLVGWASCGTQHPEWGDDLTASQPIFEAPDAPPEGAVSIDITADDQVVGPTTLDEYREFRFNNVVTQDRYIQRIEPIVDESRVVHHITVQFERTGKYLYAWAPGTKAIELPNGGLRLRPSDALVVQIHYNNGEGLPDMVDSSGMRLWLVDEVATEYAMVAPVTWDIYVPAQSESTAHAKCRAGDDFTVIAGMPHMHDVGDTFVQTVTRGDGTVETMIELSGWSF